MDASTWAYMIAVLDAGPTWIEVWPVELETTFFHDGTNCIKMSVSGSLGTVLNVIGMASSSIDDWPPRTEVTMTVNLHGPVVKVSCPDSTATRQQLERLFLDVHPLLFLPS